MPRLPVKMPELLFLHKNEVYEKMDILATRRDTKAWRVASSKMAKHTVNPIRRIVDGMEMTPNPNKDMIALSLGDPTIFGNLGPAEEAEQAVIDSIRRRTHNGYTPSFGIEPARQAVAKYVSTQNNPLQTKDVILTNGCSGAIELVIAALVNPGQSILIPRPGFCLYQTLAESLGLTVYHYNLLPEKEWEVDLKHLESLITDGTALIVVNNPSNPCGSVFSKDHLRDILIIAEKYKVPLLADEVYAHFVFKGEEYHSIASLTREVPVFACAGLTKRFIVPGWRLGWVAIHDPCDHLGAEVRKGLVSLTQRFLGPNSLLQGALETILTAIPKNYFDDVTAHVQENAELFYERIRKIPGLRPVMPRGAMYMMIGIDMNRYPQFRNDMEFTEEMVKEQSVFCLPGKCFQYPNYFRVVLTIPKEKLITACERIQEFCETHYSQESGILYHG